MRKEDLREGLIVVSVVHFDGPVRVLSCTENGSILQLVAIGLHSGVRCDISLEDSEMALLCAPAKLNAVGLHKPILRDGKLTIPLYHGTSSLFVDSIRQTGLGGRNFIQELRVVDLLGKLVPLCREELKVSDEDEDLVLAKRILNQEGPKGGPNFRHGRVYLSPAGCTAQAYANNEYGSEAIQCAMNLYRRIQDARPTGRLDLQPELAPLLEFVQRPRKSILIEVRDMPVEILHTETGLNLKKHLTDLEETLNLLDGERSIEECHQQTNFEAVQPISPSLLTMHHTIRDEWNTYSRHPYF